MEEREIHLRDYFIVINNRRIVVLSVLLLTIAAAALSTLREEPFFKATSKVMFELNELNVLKTGRYANISYEEFFDSQFQIFKSPVFVQRVINKMIERKLLFDGDIGESGPGGEGDGDGDRNERMNRLIKRVTANINARLMTENSNIAFVSYISDDPVMASKMANLITDEYIEYHVDNRMKYARTTLDWMNKKAEEALQKLNESEAKLQKYMKANDILTLENRVAIIPQRLSQLSTHLTEIETERNELEIIYQKILETSGDPEKAVTLPIVSEHAGYLQIQQQIFEAEQKKITLSGKYGDRHPVMIRTRKDLAVLKEKKEKIIRNIIESEKLKYEMIKEKEENIRKRFLKTKEQAIELSDKFIDMEVLQKDIKTNRDIYESLVSQVKEQAIFGDVQQINISVVEYSQVPSRPMPSSKKKKLLLGFFLGLFGGIGLAFFVEYFDQTIKTPYDVAKHFDLPVLGAIPYMKTKTANIESIVVDEPISFQAECYKTIRMSILLSSEEKPPKCILLTSHSAGDGKTTTSVNLAAAIAQTENTVLLIDGDLRRSNIHKILNLQNSVGLSTLLGESSKARGVIQKGPLPNMGIITAGPTPKNPSELFCSKKMSVLVALLRKKYDYIIIDGPIMGVTDSLILSKYADTTIVVAKAGRTTYEFLEAGINALRDIKADLMGIVINGLSKDRSKRYYYDSDDEYFSVNAEGYFDAMDAEKTELS